MNSLLHVVALAAGALVASVWQGTVLAVCVAVCLRLLPGVSAAARSVVWLGVFAVVLGLHFGPLAHGDAAAGRGEAIHVGVGWSLALAVVWGLLSVVRAGQFAVSAWHLRGVSRRAVPIASDGGSGVPVFVSVEVDRPCVVGFVRPRVVLPPELLERLTPAELEQVLLHEAEHLRRGDAWTNLLQKLALVVFPLHPVLLWVERRLCLERELACDDCVLRATGAPKAYATCLTNLAEQSMLRRGISLALGAWERKSELARRVHWILRAPERGMSAGAVRWATAAMMVGLVGGGIGLARGPELVSFAGAAQVQDVAREALPLPESVKQRTAEMSELPARATLVKAVMPGTGAGPGLRPSTKVVAHAKFSRETGQHRGTMNSLGVLRLRPAQEARQTSLRMTAFSLETDSLASQGRLVLTLASGDGVLYRVVPAVERLPAYAAVPVSTGWIVFQL